MPPKNSTIGMLVRKSSDLALRTAGHARSTITVRLKNVGIYRLRFSGGSARLHVKVFVDGALQARAEVAHDASNSTWHSSSPLKLLAHPSSVIKFCVCREDHVLHRVCDDQVVGQFEGRLVSFLNSETQYLIGSKACPNSTMQVTLDVDYGATLQDPALEFALHQVERLADSNALRSRANPANPHLSALGQAIQHIDKVLDVLDSMAELHAFCKVAWVLLLSVYKSVKTQVELDADLRRLVCELRDSLALIREFNDANNMAGAGMTIQAVLQLVIEATGLIDEWIHMKTIRKAVRATAFDRRIRDCTSNLAGLRPLMSVLVGQEYIIRNVMAQVSQMRQETRSDTEGVRQLLERLQPFTVQPPANEDPVPEQASVDTTVAESQETAPAVPGSEQSPTFVECPPVQQTPSNDSHDSRESQNSTSTQSTALPPYTLHPEQPPPFFAAEASVELFFEQPVSEEPVDLSSPPDVPEQKQPLDFPETADVLLVFDSALLQDLQNAALPSQSAPPTHQTEYPEEKKVEPAVPGSKHWWKRHSGGARAVASMT